MSKKPPIRPGITFEIGARLEAQDYLQKWYPSKIEKIDYEEGKMLVHFERWSSRYDEWINWDSSRIRPLEKPAFRKEELRDNEENIDFKEGEEVLARWTDCRYYPAKIEAITKEGTYTVQFYDGVIRCLKKMHLKYMPEDAKGQDWIALVKAAAAAAKNKAGNKPRTSVNSNKDKDERKLHRASLKKEAALACKPQSHEEEEPTSSRNLGPALEEDPMLPLKQREEEIVLKRKISQVSSFQAKRARLNKITGLLASKAVVLDDAEKKDQVNEMSPRLEEAITPNPQTQKHIEADICLSGTTVKTSLLPPSLSSGKSRRKKDRQKPDDVSGCKKFPLSNIDPQIKQGTPHNANVSRPFGRNKQRRRSQRLTPESSGDSPSIPFSDGKVLPGYVQSPRGLSVAKVPDVTFAPQEKLEPLDLSRSAEITVPVVPKSSFHIGCPPKEKEHLKLITYPPKAVADGRTTSATSVSEPPVLPQHLDMALPNNVKPAKGSKKKRLSSCVNTDGTETSPSPAAGNKLSDILQEKIIKKLNEKDKHAEVGVVKSEKKGKTEDKTSSGGKKKDKDKDWKDKKEKDHFKSKKKKKKKKKQQEYSDYEDSSLEFIERLPSPVMRSPSCTPNNTVPAKNTSLQFPCAILSVDLTGENLSDMELLDDSSTESLILSGDEYNLEFDSTNFEESQDEEEAINEIVRCVCEMDEENGFMIQCEECLCWQHSVCMGLLEDSIPEQYICYVCSNPPGQRWSAKYRYDRDWFNNGHMCGLSFINENYSYLNAKKIVSTHHLLADVYGVTEILHGLQLKFGILKNKDHPDLRLWAYPSRQWESGQAIEKRAVGSANERSVFALNHKGPASKVGKMEETYITSEHSYQKPQSSGNGGKPTNDSVKSEDGVSALPEGQRTNFQTDTRKNLSDPLNVDRRSNQGAAEELCNDKKGGEEQLESHLQWQLNLLTHIESVQNEVTNHMDLIEKEVDVLESWLDFTGELEPPDPLARLPQLKRRIKQLLVDMGKVQQIATLCSV